MMRLPQLVRASPLTIMPTSTAFMMASSMRMCSSSTTTAAPPPTTATPTPATTTSSTPTTSKEGGNSGNGGPQVAILEVWEHFKQFSTADGGDNVTVRMQCPNSTLSHINETVRHRHYPLQRAFAHLPPHSAKQIVERGWIVGSLKDVPNGSRKTLLEAFLKEGWSIQSHNVTLSEREWLIQTTLFTKK